MYSAQCLHRCAGWSCGNNCANHHLGAGISWSPSLSPVPPSLGFLWLLATPSYRHITGKNPNYDPLRRCAGPVTRPQLPESGHVKYQTPSTGQHHSCSLLLMQAGPATRPQLCRSNHASHSTKPQYQAVSWPWPTLYQAGPATRPQLDSKCPMCAGPDTRPQLHKGAQCGLVLTPDLSSTGVPH